MGNKLFDAKKLMKLNNPDRLRWLPPVKLWELLAVSNPSKLADIGAGTGFLTQEISKLAPNSEIFALDIQEPMIDYLTLNMPENIKPILISGGIFPIPDKSLDGLWSITVYHELDDRDLFLSEIKRVLKTTGKVLIVDWAKDELACESGPEYNHRVSAEEIVQDLERNKFKNIQIANDLKLHYAVTASIN